MTKLILKKRDLIKALDGFKDTDDVVIDVSGDEIAKVVDAEGIPEDRYPFRVSSVEVVPGHREILLELVNEGFEQVAQDDKQSAEFFN